MYNVFEAENLWVSRLCCLGNKDCRKLFSGRADDLQWVADQCIDVLPNSSRNLPQRLTDSVQTTKHASRKNSFTGLTARQTLSRQSPIIHSRNVRKFKPAIAPLTADGGLDAMMSLLPRKARNHARARSHRLRRSDWCKQDASAFTRLLPEFNAALLSIP